MTNNVLPVTPEETPDVTYTVMWVDENGAHIEAQRGLSFKEAMIKVRENKDYGFHSYPAAEGNAVLTQGVAS